jgi:serine/threonine protein kinase
MDNHITSDCKDFIFRCLSKDPEVRIGFKDDGELLEHPWFGAIEKDKKLVDAIEKEKLLKFEINAPIIPEINSETDVENFNTKYTNERPKMTLMGEDMLGELKKYDPMFTGFYYDQISTIPPRVLNESYYSDGEDDAEQYEDVIGMNSIQDVPTNGSMPVIPEEGLNASEAGVMVVTEDRDAEIMTEKEG